MLTAFDNTSCKVQGAILSNHNNNPNPNYNSLPQTSSSTQTSMPNWMMVVSVHVCVCVCNVYALLFTGLWCACQMLHIAGGQLSGYRAESTEHRVPSIECQAINSNLAKSRRCPHQLNQKWQPNGNAYSILHTPYSILQLSRMLRIGGDIRVKTMYALEVI